MILETDIVSNIIIQKFLINMIVFIFICNNNTQYECFKHSLFGTDNNYYWSKYFSKINIGDQLFLFNYETRLLYGNFIAKTKAMKNINSTFCNGNFPYQVSFMMNSDFITIPESKLKEIINFGDVPFPVINDPSKIELLSTLNLQTI